MSTELECLTIEPAEAPTHLVVWLHGLGADGGDFHPVGQMMRFGEGAHVKFIFPHAPVRPITLNGGMSMRGWYDILGMELANREDEAGVLESSQAIQDLIRTEAETLSLTPERVFLAGFSQGGAVAIYAGLTAPFKLGGIIALSTYMPIADTLHENQSEHKLPILQVHGLDDPLVKEEWGRQSHEKLKSLGHDAEYHTYPMEHSVHPLEIALIEKWIRSKL